jgi:hypothetical protein
VRSTLILGSVSDRGWKSPAHSISHIAECLGITEPRLIAGPASVGPDQPRTEESGRAIVLGTVRYRVGKTGISTYYYTHVKTRKSTAAYTDTDVRTYGVWIQYTGTVAGEGRRQGRLNPGAARFSFHRPAFACLFPHRVRRRCRRKKEGKGKDCWPEGVATRIVDCFYGRTHKCVRDAYSSTTT